MGANGGYTLCYMSDQGLTPYFANNNFSYSPSPVPDLYSLPRCDPGNSMSRFSDGMAAFPTTTNNSNFYTQQKAMYDSNASGNRDWRSQHIFEPVYDNPDAEVSRPNIQTQHFYASNSPIPAHLAYQFSQQQNYLSQQQQQQQQHYALNNGVSIVPPGKNDSAQPSYIKPPDRSEKNKKAEAKRKQRPTSAEAIKTE